MVAKRAESKYREGRRSRDWLKVKTHGRQEFAIAGYTRGEGRRAASFGSLVLAVNEGGVWRWVGNAGSGLTEDEIDRLLALMRPLERATPPFPEAPKMPRIRKGEVVWVEPRLVAEVEFTEWTRDGRLRHPIYKGLRDDKPSREVRRERPAEEVVRRGRRELRLSNLDKVFWPDDGITKGDLVGYYRQVAPALVPHLRSRPFTMRRYPDGIDGKAFFQKDAPVHMPDWIPTHRAVVSTRQGSRKLVDFPLVNDELALLWMANMGCIDMNPWLSRADRPDRPDVVLFDLDPTPEVPWSQTIAVALLVRELLDAIGLRVVPEDLGRQGVPRPGAARPPLDLRGRAPVRRARRRRDRAHASGARDEAVVEGPPPRRPDRREPERRREDDRLGLLGTPAPGRAGVDAARLGRGRPELDPAAFTMGAVLARVERLGDLHAPVLTTRQSLSKALRAVATS